MLGLGELGDQVAQAMNAAVLTVSTGPELLHGADQPRGAIGDNQAWCA
jgi:hypothetical protein